MYLDPFSRLSTALQDRVENLRSLDRLLAERVALLQSEAARFAQKGILPHLREQCRLCHRSHWINRNGFCMPRDLRNSTGQQQCDGPRQRDAPWNVSITGSAIASASSFDRTSPASKYLPTYGWSL